MDSTTIKELIYGGVSELMKNRRFYYHSTIGESYSFWTPEGTEALLDFVMLMSKKMIEAEEVELDKRAKAMVLKELRGEED
jgi:hypothetical protein